MYVEPIKRATLTVPEVAEYLGVSRDTIYVLCRENNLIHFRIGSRILFRKEKVDEWIDRQMQGGEDHD